MPDDQDLARKRQIDSAVSRSTMRATLLGCRREIKTESQRCGVRKGKLRGLVCSALEIAELLMTVRVSMRAPENGMRARPRRVVPFPVRPNQEATLSALRAQAALGMDRL